MHLYKKTECYIRKLKRIARCGISCNDIELALNAIMSASFLQYEYNQNYVDEELETHTLSIANKLGKMKVSNTNMNIVLFYDGFGHDTRGLGLIYILALLKMGKRVIYITKSKAKNKQTQMDKETKGYDFVRVFIPDNISYKNQVEFMEKVYLEYKPRYAFMQALPYDVSAVVLFERMNDTMRFQINLTDHAFWLGTHSFDYCLNFRDYGQLISKRYRGIKADKLIKLPYYPYYDKSMEFKGFDFIDASCRNKRIIFSGGDCYKTISKDLLFYKIVTHILDNFPDTIFVYAGRSSCKQLDDLVCKYPKRVYYIEERDDLFQVMKHIYLYINTYPLLGGLMTQYAAIAGKLPITLKHDQDGDDILLHQEKLGVFFDEYQDLINEINKIMTDSSYLHDKEEKMLGSVITPDLFEIELKKCLLEQKTSYSVSEKIINIERIREDYKNRLTLEKVEKCVIRRNNPRLYLFFPILFLKKLVKVLVGNRII